MASWAWVYCRYPCCIGELRYVIAIFAFLVVLVGSAQRAVMNIAIVVIVDHQEVNSTCPAHPISRPIIMVFEYEKTTWTELEQGYTLGAFYIGYIFMHIPAGIICDRYGPRDPLFWGLVSASLATALIPLGVNMLSTWWAVGVLRVLTGLGQGTILPGASSLIMRWFPPLERSTVTAAILAANSIGMVVGHIGTGMWIHFWGTWPPAFYLWASIGLALALFLLVYVFSDPQTHPFLHPAEFSYLESTMTLKKDIPTPYKAILRDRCIYGLIIMEMGHALLLYTLRNNFPKYLNQVLGLNIFENGLTGMLFLLQWVGGFGGGLFADFLLRKRNIRVSFLRKLYTYCSNFGGFACLCAAVLFECNVVYALVFFGATIFLKGLFYCGGMVNIIEITIHHSGFVMSLVSGIGACMGVICSVVIGIIAKENTFYEWQLVVAIIGIMEVSSLLLYTFLVSSKRRPWDYAEDEVVEPPKGRPQKWYKQLSNSDHQLRLQRDKAANDEMKEAMLRARAKMKQDIRDRRQAR